MKRVLCGALAVVSGLALTGCDYRGASSLPLPGSVGADGYAVTITFDDATNLVVKETCRANDVVVGTVASIELDEDLRAKVVCRIKNDISLPANVVATLRETSLLGERYVDLSAPPDEEPVGTLPHDAVVPLADSHVAPDVEIVFGALSQVLNGGGLSAIETINRELSTALSGSDVGGTARQLDNLVATLDANRDDITATLESLDDLASQLADQRSVVGATLDEVPAGLAVLDRQRPRLVKALDSLSDLSEVALPLIRDSKADTVADLKHLAPILRNLARAKGLLARAVEGVITFPFPSNTLYAAKGDYAGMYASFTLDIDSLNTLLEQEGFPTTGGDGTAKPPTTPSDDPTDDPLLPGIDLPDLPGVPDLPSVPGLPDLPGLGGLGLGRTVAPDKQPTTLGELLVAAS